MKHTKGGWCKLAGVHGSSSNDGHEVVAFRPYCLHLHGEARKRASIGSEQRCRLFRSSCMRPTRRSDTPHLSLSQYHFRFHLNQISHSEDADCSSETSEHLTFTCCTNAKEVQIVLCVYLVFVLVLNCQNTKQLVSCFMKSFVPEFVLSNV